MKSSPRDKIIDFAVQNNAIIENSVIEEASNQGIFAITKKVAEEMSGFRTESINKLFDKNFILQPI